MRSRSIGLCLLAAACSGGGACDSGKTIDFSSNCDDPTSFNDYYLLKAF